MRISGINKDDQQFFGTAFAYHVPIESNTELPLLVSNKHVLMKDAKSLTATALKKNSNGGPDYGNPVTIDLKCSDCGQFHIYEHPTPEVDVAAVNIGKQIFKSNIFHRAVGPANSLLNQPPERGLRESTLESIMFVGYPNGIYDTHNIMPIARFGQMATLLDFNYMGRPQFLVDAAVFGGSSGSPVFVQRKFQRSTATGISIGEEPYFVGVLAAVHQKTDYGPIVPVNFAAQINKEIGLGLVFKESTVNDVLNIALSDYKTKAACLNP